MPQPSRASTGLALAGHSAAISRGRRSEGLGPPPGSGGKNLRDGEVPCLSAPAVQMSKNHPPPPDTGHPRALTADPPASTPGNGHVADQNASLHRSFGNLAGVPGSVDRSSVNLDGSPASPDRSSVNVGGSPVSLHRSSVNLGGSSGSFNRSSVSPDR